MPLGTSRRYHIPNAARTHGLPRDAFARSSCKGWMRGRRLRERQSRRMAWRTLVHAVKSAAESIQRRWTTAVLGSGKRSRLISGLLAGLALVLGLGSVGGGGSGADGFGSM
jgi:hypothetical protein